MSWVDDALYTPESVVTEFAKDHLPDASGLIILWTDNEGNVSYQASQMRIMETLGMLEMTKAMLFEYLAEDGDVEE